MSLEKLLKRRDLIYGLLAVWIMVFHINRRLGEKIYIPIFSQIVLCGNMAVDVFMFFSGCCLYLSYAKNENLKLFYTKRFDRLIPSYLLITIPFWVWKSLVEFPKTDGGFDFVKCIADLTSATFWLKGVQTTWFIYAIFVFYLLFPLLYKIVNKGLMTSLLLLLAIYLLNVIGTEFLPIFDYSSIAWTRLPIFVMGIIAGKDIARIDFVRTGRSLRNLLRVGGILLLAGAVVVFQIGTVFANASIKSEYLWLAYGPLTLLLILLLILIPEGGGAQEGQGNKLVRQFGRMTLELYMTHIILLNWFTYYKISEKLGLFTFLAIPVLATVWSSFVKQIVNLALENRHLGG